jgi:hypothetical protein
MGGPREVGVFVRARYPCTEILGSLRPYGRTVGLTALRKEPLKGQHRPCEWPAVSGPLFASVRSVAISDEMVCSEDVLSDGKAEIYGSLSHLWRVGSHAIPQDLLGVKFDPLAS